MMDGRDCAHIRKNKLGVLSGVMAWVYDSLLGAQVPIECMSVYHVRERNSYAFDKLSSHHDSVYMPYRPPNPKSSSMNACNTHPTLYLRFRELIFRPAPTFGLPPCRPRSPVKIPGK